MSHNRRIVMTITKKDLEKDINKDINKQSLDEVLELMINQVAKTTSIDNLEINTHIPTCLLAGLKPVHINRNYKRRVAKQTPNFKKDLMGQKIFIVFNVTEELQFEFHGETINVPPARYIADGNTRLEAHRQGKIDLGSHVIAISMEISDADTYKEEYFAIDNSAATENSSDLIRSAIRFLGMNLDSNIGQGGNFASALKNSYPHDKKDETIMKVAYFKSEIELLDECGVFNTTDHALKHQHFYGACLLAAKLYAEPGVTALKFKQVLKQICRLDSDDWNLGGDKWNGITALLYQCANPHKKGWIPEDCIAKTNYASIEPSYNFYLYCIEMAMTDKMLNKTKGFKRSNWEGYYTNTLDAIVN